MRFFIRDVEGKNVIDKANTIEEARSIVKYFEDDDKECGSYTEDFYEIIDTKTYQKVK